jgi:hypothetical protein
MWTGAMPITSLPRSSGDQDELTGLIVGHKRRLSSTRYISGSERVGIIPDDALANRVPLEADETGIDAAKRSQHREKTQDAQPDGGWPRVVRGKTPIGSSRLLPISSAAITFGTSKLSWRSIAWRHCGEYNQRRCSRKNRVQDGVGLA